MIEMPGEVWMGEVHHHFCVLLRHVFCCSRCHCHCINYGQSYVCYGTVCLALL